MKFKCQFWLSFFDFHVTLLLHYSEPGHYKNSCQSEGDIYTYSSSTTRVSIGRFIWVMSKIMKPTCDKMVRKHGKWTPTLMPQMVLICWFWECFIIFDMTHLSLVVVQCEHLYCHMPQTSGLRDYGWSRWQMTPGLWLTPQPPQPPAWFWSPYTTNAD